MNFFSAYINQRWFLLKSSCIVNEINFTDEATKEPEVI